MNKRFENALPITPSPLAENNNRYVRGTYAARVKWRQVSEMTNVYKKINYNMRLWSELYAAFIAVNEADFGSWQKEKL